MFNPFKKKDNEFKLDEFSLPSLGDDNKTSSSSSMPDLPPLPSLDSPSSTSSSSLDLPPLPSPSEPSMDPISTPSNSLNNNFDSTPPIGNPMLNPPNQTNTPEPTNQTSNNQDLHNDLIKAKIENMENKIALIDVKLANIDSKLEMIYAIIMEEVSEDTKRKLQVKGMMNTIKNQ